MPPLLFDPNIPESLSRFLSQGTFSPVQLSDLQHFVAPGISLPRGLGQLEKFGFGGALQAARAREELFGAQGAQLAAFANVNQPLEEQLKLLREQRGGNVLGGTARSAAQASNLARMSGGGGNAQAFAVRGAQAGAQEQAQALNQLLGIESQTSAALTSARQQQAGAISDILGRPAQLSMNIAQMLAGLGAPGSQIEQAQIGRKAGFEQSIISAFTELFS